MQFTFDRINNNKYLNTIYSDELLENGTFVVPKVDCDYAYFNENLQVWELIYPDGYVEPKNVPFSVTKRQLLHASLVVLGIDEDIINAKIDLIPDELERKIMRNYFKNSGEYERYHEKTVEFLNGMGITKEQGDDLFILADTL